MPQRNYPQWTLYRILAGISLLTLWAGQAFTPHEPTQPPTPAEADYGDWTARRLPIRAQLDAAPAYDASAQDICTYDSPSQERYTALVYSGLSGGTNWNEDIYFRYGLCGNTETRVNTNAGSDIEPRLNRDSTQIVFVSARNSTSKNTITNIYMMAVSGENQKRLTTTTAQDHSPAFSPDGSRIVFVSNRAGNPEIYTMNSDGSNLVRLTNAAEADVEPDWSPDGQSIAWVRRVSSTSGVVYRMNADGSDQHAILPPLPYAGQPVWSTSGTQLALRLDADGDGWYELATAQADGSGLAVLPLAKGPFTDLELGSWLAFDRGLVFDQINYQKSNNQWLISAAGAGVVHFDNLADIYGLNNYRYMFSPSARSLDDVPPVSTIAPLPEFSPYNQVELKYTVTDAGSYPYSMLLQGHTSRESDWQILQGGSFYFVNSSYSGTYTYTGEPGTTATFRIQAVDKANNVEALKTMDASTKLYTWAGQVTVQDAREYPLEGVQTFSDPPAMNQPVTAPGGGAQLYFPVTGRYGLKYSHAGYAAAPAQKWSMDTNKSFQAVLTGPDEQLLNGHFEDTSTLLAGWQTGGDLPGVSAPGRYGGTSARLGKVCSDVFCLSDPTRLGLNYAALAISPQGLVFVSYGDRKFATIGEDGVLQPWPDLPDGVSSIDMQFDPNGYPYMLTGAFLDHWDGSAWVKELTPISAAPYNEAYRMDVLGRLHVAYYDSGSLVYTRRNLDGSWQLPVHAPMPYNGFPALAVEPDGTAHIVYYGDGRLNYLQVRPDWATSGPVSLGAAAYVQTTSLHFASGQGLILVSGTQDHWIAKRRGLDGQWSELDAGDGLGEVRRVRADAAGNLYVLARNHDVGNNLVDVRYSILSTGENAFHMVLVPRELAYNADFAVDLLGRPHFVYPVVNADWQTESWYRRGSPEAQAETSALAQTLTIGPAMQAPTLSFNYRIDSANPASQSRFQAVFSPAGGDAVVLFDHLADTAGWSHAWADLSPYQGQAGTLAFRLLQSAGDFAVQVFMDEVSVSSWPTPVPSAVRPAIPYPIQTGAWVDLFGQNLQPGAQVYFNGLPAAGTEWVDASHLRFLPASVAASGSYGTVCYVLKVVNPGGGEGQIIVRVGNYVFGPFVGR